MIEALKEQELRLLVALWVDGGWVRLPAEMRATVSQQETNSKTCFRFKIRDARRIYALGYVEAEPSRTIMNLMTGRSYEAKPESFRITRLGIARLTRVSNAFSDVMRL